ncbi:MAG: transcriptional repressor LexA, partial [Chloroflexi bacterium]|nr:transcriptional repressor LexA [Chloroflexota bacterium]
MPEISAKRQQILEFIEEFIDEHDYPPTVRDIQNGCGMSSTSVVKYNLDWLTNAGFLNRDSEVSRGIAIPGGRSGGRAAREPEKVTVPLMGTIAAGSPFPLPQSDTWSDHGIEQIDLPQAVVGRGSGVYALKVKGESMIDALIGDGDLVIMESTHSVRDGQMAAVRLIQEDETTLKYFFPEGNRVRLQPANSQMAPIYAQ